MSKADTLAKLVSAGGPLVDGAIAVSDISGLQTTLDGKLALSGGTLTGNLTFNGTQTWPTFNQNTTGSAATATTATNVSGGTANVTTLTTSSTVTYNGGTANGVAYLNGSKVLTTGSALTFEDTVPRLGFAASAGINATMEIAGNGNTIGTTSFMLRQNTANVALIYNRANGDMAFGVNNTEQMRLTSTGLGIGTSSPTYKFEIRDQNNVGFGLYQSNDNDGALVRGFRAGGTLAAPTGVGVNANLTGLRGFGYNSSGAYSSLSAAMDFYAAETFTSTASGSYITFRSTSAGTTSPTERMRITDSGNVGIGTNSPGLSGSVGRSYLTLMGSGTGTAGIGVLQLASSTSASVNNGNIEWIDVGNTSSTALRNAYISSGSSGASANNLGSYIDFATKADGVAGAGSTRLRIDSVGRLLVGATGQIGTSAAGLQILQVTNPAISIAASTTPASSAVSYGGIDAWAFDGSVYFAGGTINFRAAEAWSTTNHGTDIQFRTTASGSGGALFEAMRITSAGNLGIGTNSPQSLLDVKNGSTYSSSGTWLARVQQNTNGIGQNGLSVMNAWAASSSTIFEAAMGWNGSAAGYYPVFTVDGLGQVIFRPERTEAMRITNAGRVGIGTSAPQGVIDVQGTGTAAQGNYAYIRGGNVGSTTPAGSFAVGLAVGQNFSSGNSETNIIWGQTVGSQQYLSFSKWNGTTVTEQMRLDSSGGLILAGSTAQKATGTTWSNPSDQRIKDNIRDYGKGITELMQIRVKEWEYNGKGGTVQGTKGLGVVADEIMMVLPDTVSTYDAKLNIEDEEVTAIKKFDATEITWLLVKTIQEQQAIITTLTDRITTLESN